MGLQWLPSFEIGLDFIDDAHRRLFAMANDVREAIDTRDHALTAVRVSALIAAAEKHFAEEEAFLAEAGYPESEAHKREHSAIIAKAKECRTICGVDIRQGKTDECYNELATLLIKDIIEADMKFKSYLEDVGLARRD